MTSCMPPASSKKRSATTQVCVGTTPSASAPSTTYCSACSAAPSSSLQSSTSSARAAPPAHALVDAIEMQVRARAAAPRGDAIAEHGDDVVEFAARQIRVRRRAAHEPIERFVAEVAGRAGGDELLRQDVERRRTI